MTIPYGILPFAASARTKAEGGPEADLYEQNARRMFFDRLKSDDTFDAAAVNADIMAWEESWVRSTAPCRNAPKKMKSLLSVNCSAATVVKILEEQGI